MMSVTQSFPNQVDLIHSTSRYAVSNDRPVKAFRRRDSVQRCSTSAGMNSAATGRPPHVPPDGPRRDNDAQFQQQFGGNPFLTPGLIRARHVGNQVLQGPRNPRTTRAP